MWLKLGLMRQSIFQIWFFILFHPKLLFPKPLRENADKSTGQNNQWASSPASIMSRVAQQPALARSFQWTRSWTSIRPPSHVACPVYGPTAQRQGSFMLFYKAGRMPQTEHPMSLVSPTGFCLSHTGQSSSYLYAFNKHQLWMLPRKIRAFKSSLIGKQRKEL